MTLIKYVSCTPNGDWMGMYDTHAEARIDVYVGGRNSGMCDHVERWTYEEQPDGSHRLISKVRLDPPVYAAEQAAKAE